MRKIIELENRFAGTGELTMQAAVLVGRNGRPLREQLCKTASDASDYCKTVEPKPGHTIVLVLALGAFERWGFNRNGDAFNQHPYKPGIKPSCGCCQADEAWVTQAETLPSHYKSFEEHGKIYRHHCNKEPDKACGDIVKAFWNGHMARVELLLGLRNEAAPDLAQRIANGEYPAVSMGTKIKFDVCSVCGHKAPTRKDYCDHLKYSMRQVMPNGQIAGALNPSPKFFDISFVVKPADLTGYMLKKVADEQPYNVRTSAELGDYLDNMDEKRAAIRKIADIDKIVRGVPVDHKTSPLSEAEAHNIQQYRDMILPAVQGMPSFDNGTLSSLAKHPVAHVLSTLSAAGVILTTAEFVKMIVEHFAPGTQVPEEVLDGIVAMQGHIFDLFAEHPQLLEQLSETGMLDHTAANVKPEIGVIAEKYLEKRSTISDYLSRQLLPPQLRAEEPNWTDPLHVSDPATGERYLTSRGAARDAHDSIAKTQLAKLVGTGALLAVGGRLAASNLPRAYRPLSWATAGLMGTRIHPDYGSQYMTDEGIPVSTMTEMRKQGGVASVGLPILGSAALVAALGHDYMSRLQSGQPVNDPEAPLGRRILDRLGSFYNDNPTLGTLGTLAAYGGMRQMFRGKGAPPGVQPGVPPVKLSEYCGTGTIIPTDSVLAPKIDLDAVAEKIGCLFFHAGSPRLPVTEG